MAKALFVRNDGSRGSVEGTDQECEDHLHQLAANKELKWFRFVDNNELVRNQSPAINVPVLPLSLPGSPFDKPAPNLSESRMKGVMGVPEGEPPIPDPLQNNSGGTPALPLPVLNLDKHREGLGQPARNAGATGEVQVLSLPSY